MDKQINEKADKRAIKEIADTKGKYIENWMKNMAYGGINTIGIITFNCGRMISKQH
jgi:hypothetical protein